MISKKSFLSIVGIIVITLMVIYFGFEEVSGLLRQANPLFVLLLCSFQVLTISLTAYLWYYLLNRINGTEISFFKVLRINLAAGFVESVTPSSKLGGEAAKIYLLKQDTDVSYNKLSTLTLIHKYISLLPFLIITGLLLLISLFKFNLPPIIYIGFIIALLIFTLIMGICLMVWKKKSYFKFGEFYEGNKVISFLIDKIDNGSYFLFNVIDETEGLVGKGQQIYLLLISLVVWVLYPIKIYLAAWVLGFEVGLLLAALATYTAYLISILPLLPGGLGSFEGTMGLVLSLNGLLFTQGLAVALLTRFITFWFPLLLSAGSTIYLISYDKISLSPKSSKAEVG